MSYHILSAISRGPKLHMFVFGEMILKEKWKTSSYKQRPFSQELSDLIKITCNHYVLKDQFLLKVTIRIPFLPLDLKTIPTKLNV